MLPSEDSDAYDFDFNKSNLGNSQEVLLPNYKKLLESQKLKTIQADIPVVLNRGQNMTSLEAKKAMPAESHFSGISVLRGSVGNPNPMSRVSHETGGFQDP